MVGQLLREHELFSEQKESDMCCLSQQILDSLVGRLCVSSQLEGSEDKKKILLEGLLKATVFSQIYREN